MSRSPDTRLRPLLLTEQICQVIKERIFRGELPPGTRLVEQKIAKELGVGQNPVREALLELAHLGMVRRVPNQGTYVTKLTIEEAHKIGRVRCVLENMVVDLIVDQHTQTPIDLSKAEAALAAMRDAAGKGDIEQFFENDMLFHRTLWRLAGDENLELMLEKLVIPLFAFFILARLRPAKLLDAVDLHERVLVELKAGRRAEGHRALDDLLALSLLQQADVMAGG